jgi:glucose-specific phosphotransferase system IIA component
VKPIQVLAPFTGRVVPLEEVPDPVFAEKMLGDGLAIAPTTGRAVAPVSGKVTVFHSAGHAFAVQASAEVTVLVHIGLDTVEMHGQGFTALVQVGQRVAAGQEVAHFDLAAISAGGYSAISPVIVPDLPSHYAVEKAATGNVRAGQDVLLTIMSTCA